VRVSASKRSRYFTPPTIAGFELRVVDEGLDQILDALHEVLVLGKEDATAANAVDVRGVERRRWALVLGPLLDSFDHAPAHRRIIRSEVPRCSMVRSRTGPIDACTAWSSAMMFWTPEY